MNYFNVFDGLEVTPEEILDSRTARAARQRAFLEESCSCMISFTLNIPGSIKQFSLGRAAFTEGLRALECAFGGSLHTRYCQHLPTGSEGIFLLDIPETDVKKKTVEIEECHPLGRLFDLDVIGKGGGPVTRAAIGKEPRKCLICNQNAKLCGRSRVHALELLLLRVAQLLHEFFRESYAKKYTACITRAMLQEVCATPKPGLVDRNNSGAHVDMDYSTFLDSAAVLAPWFHDMFCTGWENADLSPKELLNKLRFLGREAEAAMYAATRGANTHKGLIFSLGAVCGAAGALQVKTSVPLTLEKLLVLCRKIGSAALEDFSDPAQRDTTSGQQAFRTYRVSGARGQLAQGFPAVFFNGLPALREKLNAGWPLNDAAVFALLQLMSTADDTNMIHRGGFDRAERGKREAASLLCAGDRETFLSGVQDLNRVYCSENLSPGGCADLLCLTLAFHFAQEVGLLTGYTQCH